MRRKLSLFLNAGIALAVGVSWARMFFAFEGGTLASVRWGSLKYFTVLSNLLAGITALITLVHLLRRSGDIPRWLNGLRWAAATAVLLTFLTVMLFLGFIYGHAALLVSYQLWMHLLVPLMALVDYLLLPAEPLPLRQSWIPVLPTLLYGIGYMINAGVNGPEADWYFLVRGSLLTGVISALAMVAGTWCIGLLVRWGEKRTG